MRAIIKGDITFSPIEASNYLLKPSLGREKAVLPHISKYEVQTNNCYNCLEHIIIDFLQIKEWIPNISPHSVLVQEKQKEILETIKDDHLPLVENTFVGTIIHSHTYSWGIFNRPVDFGIEFRIKQPIPNKLRNACEKLVSDIHGTTIPFEIPRNYGEDNGDPNSENNTICGTITIKLLPQIDVLEPGSEHQAFGGEIMTEHLRELAFEEKSVEVKIGTYAAIFAVLLLVITIPPIFAVFNVGEPWVTWIKGTLDRLSTSAIFSSAVSWVNVYLHYQKLKEQKTAIIRWSTNSVR